MEALRDIDKAEIITQVYNKKATNMTDINQQTIKTTVISKLITRTKNSVSVNFSGKGSDQ